MEQLKTFFKDNKRLIIILSVLIIGIAIIAHFFLKMANSTNESFQNVDDGKPKDVQSEKDHKHVYDKKNMSVLLLGTDKPSDGSKDVRTDAIILATYNSKSNDVKMVRIPRDMYIEYKGYKGKINGAYQALGISELKHLVEDYTGVPVTNYVTTDFSGLSNIVDSLDGVEINSKIKIDESNNEQVGDDIYVDKGKQTLNGKEALAYSRIRYIDNDIERGKRQEEVLKAIANKLMSAEEIPHAQQNIETLSKYINSDISPSTMVSYIPKASDKPKIDTIQFEWTSFEYQQVSYVYLTDKERHKISNTLRKHLGINTLKDLKDMVLKPKGAKTQTEDDYKKAKDKSASKDKNSKDSDENMSAKEKDDASRSGKTSDDSTSDNNNDNDDGYDEKQYSDEAGLSNRIKEGTRKAGNGEYYKYDSDVKQKDDNAGVNVIPDEMQ